jgi:hypothetical protein
VFQAALPAYLANDPHHPARRSWKKIVERLIERLSSAEILEAFEQYGDYGVEHVQEDMASRQPTRVEVTAQTTTLKGTWQEGRFVPSDSIREEMARESEEIGGKGFSLRRLRLLAPRLGFECPPLAEVTIQEGYDRWIALNHALADEHDRLVAEITAIERQASSDASTRRLVALRQALDALCDAAQPPEGWREFLLQRTSGLRFPLIVRDTRKNEDRFEQSQAGSTLSETVDTEDDLQRIMKEKYRRLFASPVPLLGSQANPLALDIQEKKASRVGGVMFTTYNGVAMIEASPGPVSNVATSLTENSSFIDLYPDGTIEVMDGFLGWPEHLTREEWTDQRQWLIDRSGDREQSPLSESQLQQIARVGKLLEREFGYPLDIEFFFGGIQGDRLYVVQARPIVGPNRPDLAFPMNPPGTETFSSPVVINTGEFSAPIVRVDPHQWHPEMQAALDVRFPEGYLRWDDVRMAGSWIPEVPGYLFEDGCSPGNAKALLMPGFKGRLSHGGNQIRDVVRHHPDLVAVGGGRRLIKALLRVPYEPVTGLDGVSVSRHPFRLMTNGVRADLSPLEPTDKESPSRGSSAVAPTLVLPIWRPLFALGIALWNRAARGRWDWRSANQEAGRWLRNIWVAGLIIPFLELLFLPGLAMTALAAWPALGVYGASALGGLIFAGGHFWNDRTKLTLRQRWARFAIHWAISTGIGVLALGLVPTLMAGVAPHGFWLTAAQFGVAYVFHALYSLIAPPQAQEGHPSTVVETVREAREARRALIEMQQRLQAWLSDEIFAKRTIGGVSIPPGAGLLLHVGGRTAGTITSRVLNAALVALGWASRLVAVPFQIAEVAPFRELVAMMQAGQTIEGHSIAGLLVGTPLKSILGASLLLPGTSGPIASVDEGIAWVESIEARYGRGFFEGKTVMVIGSGAVGSAIAYALAEKNVGQIILATKKENMEKTSQLAERLRNMGVGAVQVEDSSHDNLRRIIPQSDVVLDATDMGRAADSNASPLPDVFDVKPDSLYADLNYRNPKAKFYQQAETNAARLHVRVQVENGAAFNHHFLAIRLERILKHLLTPAESMVAFETILGFVAEAARLLGAVELDRLSAQAA